MSNNFRSFQDRRRLILIGGAVLLVGLAAFGLRTRLSGPDAPVGGAPAERPSASVPASVSRVELDKAAPLISPEILPGAPHALPPPSATTSAPLAPEIPAGQKNATYDERIAALIDAVQAVRATGPEASVNVPLLLASAAPPDQIAGFVLLAGLDLRDLRPDFSRHSPESVLAAVDLCQTIFGETQARTLRDRWIESMGGNPNAGVKAHDLLLEARLPYGGGSAALDLMTEVNDPQAILIGLYEFAVNPKLPSAVRTEALVRLRDHMDVEAYRNIAQTCIDQVREDGDEWATRAESLLEWAGVPEVDRLFVEKALAQPYSGMVADLESFLRHGLARERLDMDRETATYLRDSLANLPAAVLTGPDRAAILSLRRQLASWQSAR